MEEPLHRALALTDEEYERIVRTLGREPNRNEVRIWADRYAVNRGNRSAVAREFLQAAARERLDRRLP